jgi:hypothetical protein
MWMDLLRPRLLVWMAWRKWRSIAIGEMVCMAADAGCGASVWHRKGLCVLCSLENMRALYGLAYGFQETLTVELSSREALIASLNGVIRMS